VRYDDPVERFLPPARGRTHGGPITLLSLATHTSGLPRNPPGLQLRAVPRWFSNPWAGFTERHLVAARRRSRPKSGGRTRYSTFGIGLLGHALGVAAGMPYPELLAQRVLIPLGMSDTDCGERAGPDLAVGYWHGRPRPPAALGGMPAAGAVRSTGRDLLRYVDALARPDSGEHPLPAALRTALAEAVLPREAVTPAGDGQGLVWNIRERPRHELYFHSGGTRGFTAFAGFSPQTGTALVALANTSPSPRAPFIQQAYLLLRELAAAEAGR
jgi:CubicO group peptidase (beta-lactamase class C family)